MDNSEYSPNPSVFSAHNNETPPPKTPEEEAASYVQLLTKVQTLPEGQNPDLATVKQISDGYRSLSKDAWDKVFVDPNDPQSTEIYLKRSEIITKCDQIYGQDLHQQEQIAAEKAINETATAHKQLANAVITKQQALFPENPVENPDSGVAFQSIALKSGGQIKRLISPDHRDFATLSPDFLDDENARQVLTFHQEKNLYTIVYKKPNSQDIPQDMVIFENLHRPDTNKFDQNTLITNADGNVFQVEVNGLPQNRESALKIATSVSERLKSHPAPPTISEIATNTTAEKTVQNIMDTAGLS